MCVSFNISILITSYFHRGGHCKFQMLAQHLWTSRSIRILSALLPSLQLALDMCPSQLKEVVSLSYTHCLYFSHCLGQNSIEDWALFVWLVYLWYAVHNTMMIRDVAVATNMVALPGHYTVPTFDSCTKCMGSPSIIHDHTPNRHPVPYAWMRSSWT